MTSHPTMQCHKTNSTLQDHVILLFMLYYYIAHSTLYRQPFDKGVPIERIMIFFIPWNPKSTRNKTRMGGLSNFINYNSISQVAMISSTNSYYVTPKHFSFVFFFLSCFRIFLVTFHGLPISKEAFLDDELNNVLIDHDRSHTWLFY